MSLSNGDAAERGEVLSRSGTSLEENGNGSWKFQPLSIDQGGMPKTGASRSSIPVAPRSRSSSSVDDVGFGEAELDAFIPVLLQNPKSRKGFLAKVFSPAVLMCLMYSAFSIAMTICNKIILTTYGFNYHMVLLLFQNGTCVILLQIARYFKLAEFESLDSKKLLAWIPLNFLFVLMLLTGFFSLNLLSVPMATIFKNSTNVLVTMGDYFFYGQTVSKGIVSSLGLMLLGAVLAGKNDLEFNAMGYMWAAANCVITASYVLYMPRAIQDSKLNAFGRVYYNNLISLPLVFLVDTLVYGDIFRMWNEPQKTALQTSPQFFAVVLFSGCVGFFLSLSSFQCVQLTSPTTYSMVGSINKVPLAFIGVAIFHTEINAASVVFISLSLAAGVLYAYTKANMKKPPPK